MLEFLDEVGTCLDVLAGLGSPDLKVLESMHARRLWLRSALPALLAAREDAERIDALRWFLSENASATFTVWANEMIEMDGLCDSEADDEDCIPSMFETLDECLDALIVARGAARATDPETR